MAEREGIIFFLILYLMIASTICGLFSNQQINLLSDYDNSYTNSINLDSNTSLNNIDYVIDTFNCNYIIDGSGLRITDALADSSLKISFPILSGESEGYYIYSFIKDTNDKIAFQFYDTALSNVPSFLIIENDNAYYSASTLSLFGSQIYSGIGDTFTVKVGFNEDENVWKYYINDELIYTYQSTTFPLIDLFSNVKNDVYLFDVTSNLLSFEQSENAIESSLSVLGNITDYTASMVKILIWSLEGLPWEINLLFIKLPEFLLGMFVLLAIKGD
jgi:hypothetical protein